MKIIDSTLSDAIAAGCDTVQLKYAGMPAFFHVADGALVTNADFPVDTIFGLDRVVACTLVGTWLPIPNLRYVFDCTHVRDSTGYTNLSHESYRIRYVIARLQTALLGTTVTLVRNHPISHSVMLWSTIPALQYVSGLVFRNSKEAFDVPIRVARWYAEAPKELV